MQKFAQFKNNFWEGMPLDQGDFTAVSQAQKLQENEGSEQDAQSGLMWAGEVRG